MACPPSAPSTATLRRAWALQAVMMEQMGPGGGARRPSGDVQTVRVRLQLRAFFVWAEAE